MFAAGPDQPFNGIIRPRAAGFAFLDSSIDPLTLGAGPAIALRRSGATVTTGVITAWNNEGSGADFTPAATGPAAGTSNAKDVAIFATNEIVGSADILVADCYLTCALRFTGTELVQTLCLGAPPSYASYILVGPSGILVHTNNGSAASVSFPQSISTGQWVVFEIIISGTALTVKINGQTVGTGTVGSDPMSFGRFGGAGGYQFLTAELGDLYAFSGLSAGDQAKMQRHMAPWRTSAYYVAADGSDSNNGWSAAAPFATMAKLQSVPFYPGDRLLLKSGDVWRENLALTSPWNAENSTRRVTLGTYGGSVPFRLLGSEQFTEWELVTGTEYRTAFTDAPAYDYGGTRPRNVFWIDGADVVEANIVKLLPGTAGSLAVGEFVRNGDYVHINIGTDPNTERIEIPRGNENGIVINDAQLVDIKNASCVFFDLNQFYSGDSHVRIYDSEFSWGAEDGISPGGLGRLEVYRSRTVRNGNIRTIYGGSGDGISAHFAMTLIVEDCHIRDNEKGGLNNLEEVNVTARRNFITGNNYNCQVLATAETSGTHTFEYNVIVVQEKDVRAGIRRDGVGNTATIIARHNTIIGYGGTGEGINGGDEVKNNIITGFDQGIAGAVTLLDYNCLFDNGTDYSGGATAGPNSLSADPLLTNAAAGDFTLLPGSPCIGAASDGKNIGAK